MRVIDIEQRTPEWHVWRSQGVSASDAAVVLGLLGQIGIGDEEDAAGFGDAMVSPYKTPWRLWAEKTGLMVPDDLSRNPHVQRGMRMEGPAIADFEERHGAFTLPLCGESSEQPVIRASLDGLTDTGEVVEIKAPCLRRYTEVVQVGVLSAAYRLYWPQVQCQLYVADAERGYLVFFQGAGLFQEFTVHRDQNFIDKALVPAMLDFWERVEQKDPPEMDPDRDIFIPEGEALELWTRLAGEYRKLAPEQKALEAELKAKKDRMNAIRDELAGMMGDFRLAQSAGVRVTRFRKAGPVDWKAIVADRLKLADSEIEGYRKDGSEQVKVTAQQQEKAEVPFDPEHVEQAGQQAMDEASGWF